MTVALKLQNFKLYVHAGTTSNIFKNLKVSSITWSSLKMSYISDYTVILTF